MAVPPLHRSHPRRPAGVYHLATARFDRYELSNKKDDLDKAILHLTESILLQPWSCQEPKPNIVTHFFNLALALDQRSNDFKQPEDAAYAAKYFRHLQDRLHEILGFPRHEVTTLLVDALAVQVEFGAGNVMQNIGEMAVLCRELLTLGLSDVDTTSSTALFARAVLSKISMLIPDQPLDQVIECLRAARKHKPYLRAARYGLAWSLICRYRMTFVNDDYEEAVSVLDELITSSSPGDRQGEFIAEAQQLLTMLAMVRSKLHETPEYSEEAIYRAHTFLSLDPVERRGLPIVSEVLEDVAGWRFRYFGPTEGLEASSPFEEYEDDDSDSGRLHKEMELLLSGIRNNYITNFDEAIEKSRNILASSTPMLHPFTSYLFELFGFILFEAFTRTGKIEYLNESISKFRQIFEHPLPQFMRFTTLCQLSKSLVVRSRSFPGHRVKDLDEAMELLSQCVDDGRERLSDRFQLACSWAIFARTTRHRSVSTAYETAVSLMQDTLCFAPTLQLQHATLAMTFDDFHRTPLDYASYQVDLYQLKEAIETLERGRALLWSEMRHLRTSVNQLLQAHPQLGNEFAAINRELEELTKSVPPSHKLSIDDGATDDLRAVDPFGRLLLQQRSLLNERDKLISQIQALPGFDSFLSSLSFDELRSGRLVWSYSRHKYGLDSSHYDETLASVLAELYNLVGKPVIDRLRQLQVPEQSRIWWCPTSVFCSLPLHAMGPISSDHEDEKRYFLDLYICSYTPTLSALIQSRNRDFGSRSSDRPSLLLVAQPDPSLPTVGGEIQVVQALDTKVTSLISEAATPAMVIDSFRHHRFVHFACHGTLEAGKPFEAGFELHGGDRLTLLEIVRSDLPTAEFAFLSACHTAEVTKGSIVDEGLHLAAAVQYCGFRSVVGTMWAMVDKDGRDLAEHFYKALFSTSRRDQGIPYHERSAKALRFAVKKLRRKRRMTLERWVNFVHYGA
ncbi:CHAT domain-containing protein [Lactarius psammicola]|nr:CHAT domain-containing protein [Lactarius psammicola]